jgi:hypothetical protein
MKNDEHNVPPLAAGPKRRPVLRGLATSGCYATALSFLFSFFKRYRERRYNDLYRMDAAGRAYLKASLLSEDYDFNLNLGLSCRTDPSDVQ